jgi:thioesterase domain-containing protein
VAWVVSGEPAPTVDHVRSFAASRLPAYMVPSSVAVLSAFPLNVNGKLDRAALALPVAVGLSAERVPVLPRTALELRLVGFFETVLGAGSVGVHDNFFELGGHSLLAVRLVEVIERLTGRRISPAVLFEHPTVAGLAAALEQQGRETVTSPIALVNPGGTRPPFFFVHGDLTAGGVFAIPLARALGNDQPLHVLHPHGTYGLPSLPSIEAMAADHVSSLRGVRPHGPYRLGGFCGGGLIAFEMARQLEAAGERVELLVLVDAALRTFQRRLVQRLVARWGAFRHLDEASRVARYTLALEHLDYWQERLHTLTRSRAERRALARRTWARMERTARRLLRMSPTAGAEAVSPPPSPISPDADIIRTYAWHMAAYAPAAYPGKVTVVRAAMFRHARADLGWSRLADEVDVEIIPGRHLEIFDGENLDTVARRIRARLEALDPA